MNKCDEILQHRQSTMTKDKKSSKNENRFKFKFPRVFFRSSDLKHQTIKEEPSSTDEQTTSEVSSPTITEDQPSLNPRDMIVHRVVYNDQDDSKVTLNYFQQKYKQILKPSLLFPKQYYNDLLNKRYFSYSSIINRHDLCLKSPNRIYPPPNYKLPLPRPITYRELEYSNNDQLQLSPPSTSSILTWNQCVRRLNTEYRLTINAVQQAKECLEKVYSNQSNSISKYPNLVVRETNDLPNNEPKKTANVTFCLPSLIPEKPSLTKRTIPSVNFSKPKLIKPVQLNTFIPFSNIEPLPAVDEKEENLDSIADIIKKFNDLSSSLSSPKLTKQSSETNLQEETTYTVETIYKSTDSNENNSSSNSEHLVIIHEDLTEEQFNSVHEEIETNPINLTDNTTSSSATSTVLQNNNSKNESSTSIPSKNNNKSISHIPKRIITTNGTNLKQPTKSITSTSKLKPPSTVVNSTTNSIKITNGKTHPQPSSTIKKSQFITESQNKIEKKIDSTSNRVKSIIHQLNTTTSSRPIISSSISNKRTSRPISTNKNIVQKK